MKPISINMLCENISYLDPGVAVHVTIRDRYSYINDGGTRRPAKMYDAVSQADITITDLEIIQRPVLEVYIKQLNNDHEMYMQMMCSYITGRERFINAYGVLALYPIKHVVL